MSRASLKSPMVEMTPEILSHGVGGGGAGIHNIQKAFLIIHKNEK